VSRAAIRVLIADDHPPTRHDIRDAVEADAEFAVVAEAADAASAIEAAVRERPDICLLDVNMPGNGVPAAWEITSRLPDAKIVMLTVSNDTEDLFRALRAGASGYLLKDMNLARLPHALRDIVGGESAIPRALVARMVEQFRDHDPRRRSIVDSRFGSELTSREWQVLELLRQGLSTSQIARRLSLAPATVRSHVASLMKKLRAPDRESLMELLDKQR
jgi:two-component system, NarL family, nitrate/nitrite response regulator NarL